jgi:hypothetical protein
VSRSMAMAGRDQNLMIRDCRIAPSGNNRSVESAPMNHDQEIDAGYLRHFAEKSRARLKKLEEMKFTNPKVPDVAIEMEREHLKKYEAQLIALNN